MDGNFVLLSCIHILVDVLNEPADARLPPTLSPGYAPGPFLLTARASIAMTTLELPAKSVLCTPGKANGNPLQNFRCYVIGIQDRNYSVVGREPVLTVQRNDLQPPENGFQWCLIKTRLPRPFLSYSGKRFIWQIGWQPSGFAEIKFNLHRPGGYST